MRYHPPTPGRPERRSGAVIIPKEGHRMIAPITPKPTAGDVAGDQAKALKPARRRRSHRRHVRNRRRRRAQTWAQYPLLVEAEFKCEYCGSDLLASVDAFMSITRDHLVARSHGGSNRRENLVLCCRTCDRLKAGAFVTDQAEARALIAARRENQQAVLTQLRELVGWSGEA